MFNPASEACTVRTFREVKPLIERSETDRKGVKAYTVMAVNPRIVDRMLRRVGERKGLYGRFRKSETYKAFSEEIRIYESALRETNPPR